MIGKLSAIVALPFTALLFWLIMTPKLEGSQNTNRFPDRVNLALRRTGHYLLLEAGDTTTRIPAVKPLSNNTWSIQLEHDFDYDRLRALLQESFALHQIPQNYDVAVVDCETMSIQLGYNNEDIVESGVQPCRSRELPSACYQLQVAFLNMAEPAQSNKPVYGTLALLLLCAGGIYYGYASKKNIAQSTGDADSSTEPGLSFGNSMLDVANLTLVSNGKRHEMTYREAKLLQLFASHPNQLLERDFILKEVWEDEGIMVGRSVDVFVSRLRKRLKADSSVQITAVHGVGYRLNC